MSKYKVGDKFVIEIKEVLENETERGTLYRTAFSTLVFDDYGLDHLTKLPEEEIIKVGDEVRAIIRKTICYGVVLQDEGDVCKILWRDSTISREYKNTLSKTGKSFKNLIDELLGWADEAVKE